MRNIPSPSLFETKSCYETLALRGEAGGPGVQGTSQLHGKFIHYVAQAGLDVLILLVQPPSAGYYKCGHHTQLEALYYSWDTYMILSGI